MFSYLRRGVLLKDSGLFDGLTDWHSHLLPGVDDGVRETDETIKILNIYKQLGVKQIWLTPHVMEDYPNSAESLKTRYEELSIEIGKCGLADGPRLKLGSENMMDNLLEERLDRKELLPIGGDADQLLVETSYYSPPMNMDRTLARVRGAGYFPVLAHPERYRYMEMKEWSRLKSAGTLFQLNIPSLIGFYGPEAKAKAEKILKKGWYDIAGFDFHSFKAVKSVLETEISKRSLGLLMATAHGNRG
ncbi:MAG: tyrosine-protein phosphatase [Candidatus Cryptobacteroides sp.]